MEKICIYPDDEREICFEAARKKQKKKKKKKKKKKSKKKKKAKKPIRDSNWKTPEELFLSMGTQSFYRLRPVVLTTGPTARFLRTH